MVEEIQSENNIIDGGREAREESGKRLNAR